MTDYTIREVTVDDAARLVAYLTGLAYEPDVPVLWTPERAKKLTVEQEREVVQHYTEQSNSLFVLAEVGDQMIALGNVSGGTRTVNRHNAELGISVHKDWRGQGVGTAMMQSMMDWARQNPILTRLELEVFAHNARAIYVYEKLGFKREGVRQRAYLKDNTYIDTLMMALLLD